MPLFFLPKIAAILLVAVGVNTACACQDASGQPFPSSLVQAIDASAEKTIAQPVAARVAARTTINRPQPAIVYQQGAASSLSNVYRKPQPSPRRSQARTALRPQAQLAQLGVSVGGNENLLVGQNSQLQISVNNTGSAASIPVSLIIKIPAGVSLSQFNQDVWLDQQRQYARLQVPTLAPGQQFQVDLNGLVQQSGDYTLKIGIATPQQALGHREFILSVEQPPTTQSAQRPNAAAQR